MKEKYSVPGGLKTKKKPRWERLHRIRSRQNPYEIIMVQSIFVSRKPLFRVKYLDFLKIPAFRTGSGYIVSVPGKNLTKSPAYKEHFPPSVAATFPT